MKKINYLIVLVAVFMFGLVNVKAECPTGKTCFNVTKATAKTSYNCPNNRYFLQITPEGGRSNISVSNHTINFYNAYLNGKEYGQTFCMAPSKHSGLSPGAYRNCERVVNPTGGSNQALDVALTIAYQELIKRGVITGDTTVKSRAIGTITFRWLEAKYGVLDLGSTYDYVDNDKYSYQWNNRKTKWNQNDAYVRIAMEVSNYAAKYGDRILHKQTTYEKLVKKGIIWTDEWKFEHVSTEQDGNKATVTFIMKPKYDDARAPEYIDWNAFDVTCDKANFGFSCNKSDVTIKKEGNQARFTVVVNTKNGNENAANEANIKFGMKITTAYADKRSPTAHMMYVNPTSPGYYQKMLLVKNFNNSFYIQTEVNVDWPGDCECEKVDGEYTGKYIVTKEVDGKTVTETFDYDDPRAKETDHYTCPDSSTCHKTYTCEKIGDEYYGDASKHPDGKPVDYETFKDECLHVCETPEESGTDHYYCKEITPDTGGEICSKEEYVEDCLCPDLKEKCDENPNGPECDEYHDKCPNCNAVVSLPSTCNDFDTESSLIGGISDINKKSTSCNPDANLIKSCVIDSHDQTGTSYEALNELKDNPYCKVWCEEDYKFTVPTARYSQSGGYFTLSAKISGTRSCYVSGSANPDEPIDEESFNKDLSDVSKQLVEAYNEYSKYVAAASVANSNSEEYHFSYQTYNESGASSGLAAGSLVGTKAEFESSASSLKSKIEELVNKQQLIINQFNSCTSGWTNDMKFDPVISYTYNEDYQNLVDGTFDMKNKEAEVISNTYCTGETNAEYECTSGAVNASDNQVPNDPSLVKTKKYVSCDVNGCSADHEASVYTTKWVKKVKTNAATFSPNAEFSTYTQYGTIRVKAPECTTRKDCLWTRLPDDALPVPLRENKGVFPFKLSFANIGQSNSKTGEDSDVLGRLIDNEDGNNKKSVLTEYVKLRPSSKCSLNENESGPDTIEPMSDSYVCAYVNNCPSCVFKCAGDNCSYDEDECPDGNCNVSCKTCIFDGEKNNFTFRTVTLNNLFPNSCDENPDSCREEGYNWTTDKAKKTIAEIQETGDNAYVEAEYSYHLNRTTMQETRKYDKAVGTYANTVTDTGDNALSCEQVTYNGIDYSVKCTSKFLEEGNGKYFEEVKRNTEFKLWTEVDSNCTDGSCLSRTDAIGPSWK